MRSSGSLIGSHRPSKRAPPGSQNARSIGFNDLATSGRHDRVVLRAELAGKVRPEIAANAGRFAASLAGGDGAGAAAVYVEDGFLLPPAGGVMSGREAIERFWRSGIEIGLRTVELEPLGWGSAASIVYEHGRYRMLLSPAAGRSKVQRGAYVVVHVPVAGDSSWQWAVSLFGESQQEKEEE